MPRKNALWWRFLEIVNAQILAATKSEDKQLGYFFVKASDATGEISASQFTGKVLFYLYNDVFRDETPPMNLFGGGSDGNTQYRFKMFFDEQSEPKEDVVAAFLAQLFKKNPEKGKPAEASAGDAAQFLRENFRATLGKVYAPYPKVDGKQVYSLALEIPEAMETDGSLLAEGFAARKARVAQENAAVKAGAIKHFFLVGGCDGFRASRSYYTDFVKKAPKDTVILTLPAFVSPNVLKILVEKFAIKPMTTAEADLAAILGAE